MQSRRRDRPGPRSRHALSQLARDIGPEDGEDPREYFQKSGRGGPARRSGPLCRQVRDTLSLVLAGDVEDEDLQGLMVHEVRPAPDATRLMVVLSTKEDAPSPEELQGRLERLRGFLRAEVARAIQRRKTPDLCFRVVVEEDLS